MDEIRIRLLAAALADHDGLDAALAAAKEAEAWLQQGNGSEKPAEPPMLFLPAPAQVIGHDTRSGDPLQAMWMAAIRVKASDVDPAAADQEPAPKARAPRSSTGGGFTPAWLAATVAAARRVHAAGKVIQPSTMSRELDIAAAAAGWRLAEMVKAGLATVTGNSNRRSYKLADAIPGIPELPIEPAAAPAAEPASAEPPAMEPSRPAVPVVTAEPPTAAPQQAEPVRPTPPSPAPAVRPTKALPALNGRRIRPSAPLPAVPAVVRQASPMVTTIDDVMQFLRGRGLSVFGGPHVFRVEGQDMKAVEMLAKANLIREGLRKPPLIVVSLQGVTP